MMKKIALTFGLIFFLPLLVQSQENIPELNQKIIEYVKTTLGTRVDRGECWDLANQALQRVDAHWDKAFVYGNPVDPEKDEIFPGDIIQFEDVVLKYQQGNTYYTETMEQHTAIVYQVIRKGVYEIAHQNTQFSGRKVGLSKLNIHHRVDGKMYFYRPTKNKEQ
ncbi:MAG: hypothetical protein V2I54_01340 [Bacteroidales bacterium]|jgi:hypothetical protein|nr:hypothetical protein [Bacteroidales bacterium]